ncbi:hypothetical protein [Pantoea agglomerans]|uniref:hypothetical protein n=1 Tax=Enterobacter agglomerans TaxID=549 RepID=UPI0007E5BC57|nr:hypothetical protein [Pantoea agglomerans]WHU90722.1 hypothetical protein A7P62_23470 [Pantoea agglomerans pv. gypsophilae]
MVCDSHQVHGLFTVADTVTESSLEASSQLNSLDVRTSRLFGEKVHTVLARADIGFAVGATLSYRSFTEWRSGATGAA